MIFGLLYFCVVILCVNRSRSSFILYRIVKRHSRQSNVRRIWTCADNERINIDTAQILRARLSLSPTSIITDRPRAELWFSIACFGVGFTLYVIYPTILHHAWVWDGGTVIQVAQRATIAHLTTSKYF